MEKIIEVNDLKKSYGNIQAVKGISFYVERGKLFSFLGPNGAGKSTTIDILCTLLACDAGSVVVDGYRLGGDDAAIRRSIGVVFQDGVLDPLLTVGENLKIRAGFYHKDKTALKQAVRNAATATDILGFIDRPYGKLSGGQRRRADIARSLVNTPQILFLDEPTTGLDPQTRQSVWRMLRTLQEKTGMTVFLTTHYMEEAAQSDYVIVIDRGEIAAKGTPAELKAKYAGDTLRLDCSDETAARAALDASQCGYTLGAGRIIVRLASTMDALPVIEKCRPFIRGFEVLRGSMDDAFIAITGKELRE